MISELLVTTIAHAIQLAVAPVFLLTGVASILSVLTNRLSRIIDRSRFLHGKLLSAIETNPAIQVEIKSLKKRAHLIHWAIGLIHISEPTRQAEISYAVFCLKKKKK